MSDEDEIYADSMLEEFKIEAEETLVEAENSLMALEDGEAYDDHYVPIFRAFHNIKGASAMFALTEINNLFHHLETVLFITKDYGSITESICGYLLSGVDEARNLFNRQQPSFEFKDPKVVTSELSGDSQSTEEPAPQTTEAETVAPDQPVESTSSYAGFKPLSSDTEPKLTPTPPSPPSLDEDLLVGEVYAVDDEQTILSLVEGTLLDANFKVTTFDRAEDLISALQLHKPDVI